MTHKKILLAVLLLWLSGAAIRLAILAVPPVIPWMRSDFQMSGTEIGILSGLPTILIAIAAIPGSFAISRFGALATLIGGLIFTAIGTALRGATFSVGTLFVATIIMSTGIAIAQPTLPVIVRQWLPTRIGFATATYSNGMIAGCIVPIVLMTSFIMPIFENNWRLALAVWSLPILIIAGLLMVLAPRQCELKHIDGLTSQPQWISLDYNLLWRLGLIFGSNNSIYFGTNAFLPGYLIDAGRPDLISVALTVYNFGQLPSSLLMIALASRIERRIWPYPFAGLLALSSIGIIVLSANYWTVVAVGALGFASGICLSLGLALPPLLSPPSHVGRVSAAMFMLSYTYAMIVSVACGFVWDLTGRASSAFLLIAISILPILILTPTIQFRRN
jgi:CP family cyanate transporter-like MFS transporter